MKNGTSCREIEKSPILTEPAVGRSAQDMCKPRDIMVTWTFLFVCIPLAKLCRGGITRFRRTEENQSLVATVVACACACRNEKLKYCVDLYRGHF